MAPADDVQVECYAGFRGAEEPRTFVLDGRRLQVLDVARRWHEPHRSCFRVRADDGHVYDLSYDSQGDRWQAALVKRADA